MGYSAYEMLGLFFLYSFLGWVLETVISATKQKIFANRGLINGPLCVIYGVGALMTTVFCQELEGVWIFIGAYLLTTVIEWVAGHLIEALYHERWWDYSKRKWNLDGYVCIGSSVAWMLLSVFAMKVVNPLSIKIFRWIPLRIFELSIILLLSLLLLDLAATLIILSGRSKRSKEWSKVDDWLDEISFELGKKIYERVDRRIRRAYPDVASVEKTKSNPGVFADGCSFHKIVWLLVIGSFLGDVAETLYCYALDGVWMSRSSVVWGPFSLVWGIGIAAVTAFFYRYQDRSAGFLFVLGTLLGGAYEYICSVFTEMIFGKVFWDYSWMPFNLGGRINLLYCFFWGFAAVAWFKLLLPKAEALIEKVPVKIGKMVTICMVLFMSVNIAVSSMALARSSQREQGIPAQKEWQKIMDERFHDERMKKIYPNAIDV